MTIIPQSSSRPSGPSHTNVIGEFGQQIHLTTVAASHSQRFAICVFPWQLPTIQDGREDSECFGHTPAAFSPEQFSSPDTAYKTHIYHSTFYLHTLPSLGRSHPWKLRLSTSFPTGLACWKLQGGPHLMTRTAITKRWDEI